MFSRHALWSPRPAGIWKTVKLTISVLNVERNRVEGHCLPGPFCERLAVGRVSEPHSSALLGQGRLRSPKPSPVRPRSPLRPSQRGEEFCQLAHG